MPSTEPTAVPSSPPTYAAPSHSDLAAVAATVSVVGVLMALLVTWLVLRLRRASRSQSQSVPVSCRPASTTAFVFRSSFAPSEASSKFGFVRKSLHLSRRREDGSWDFADPDPFFYSKEHPLEPPLPVPSPQHRPAPLSPVPAYVPRARRTSTHRGEAAPRTPTAPGTPCVEPPPPAYCPDGAAPWPLYQPKDLSTS